MKHINWTGFKDGVWQDEINVRDFIQQNYAAYEGDAEFLSGATERTEALMKKIRKMCITSDITRKFPLRFASQKC